MTIKQWDALSLNKGLVHVAGYNGTVGATAEEIWDASIAFNFPSSAGKMQISSSSSNDDVTGSHMRTAYLWGLDEDWEEVSETLSMDGQTAVETANQYIRVFGVRGVTVGGTGPYNAGDVYISDTGATLVAGVPSDTSKIRAKILAGVGESRSCVFTVPAKKKGYLVEWYASADGTTKVEIVVREYGQLARVVCTALVLNHLVGLAPPITLADMDSKADIWIRGTTASAQQVAAGMMIALRN